MTPSARKPIGAEMRVRATRTHREQPGRASQAIKNAPQANEWRSPPHCNTPLRHPDYQAMDTEQKVALWRELTSGVRAKGLRERLQKKYAEEMESDFSQFEPERPLPERRQLFTGLINFEASETEHVFQIVNYIPLANFLGDLPFADRLIMLEVALPILLDTEVLPSGCLIMPPVDSNDPNHDLRWAQAEFSNAYTSAVHLKPEYERGTQRQSPLSVCLDDLFDVTYNESWDGPEEARKGPKWIITRAPGSLSDEYLEGVLTRHPIRWVTTWDNDRLFSVFGLNAHLRRLAFGLYANDSFTIGKVQRWRKNPLSLREAGTRLKYQ